MPPTHPSASSAKRKNSLQIYLEERHSRHVCPRTWLPKVYRFDEKELLYQENAYDRYVHYAQEEESAEDCSAHAQFLDYLQSIPNDTSMFYRWIKDVEAVDKSRVFRATTHPSINEDLKKFRETYTSQKMHNSIAPTEFPFDEAVVLAAESFAWMFGTRKSSPQVDVKVGWLKVDLIEDACYGPRRFYVRPVTTSPDKKFDAGFRIYNKQCIRENFRLYSQRKVGCAVYYDPDKDLYSSVVVMGEGGGCMVVYEMDTGRVIRVPNMFEKNLRNMRPKVHKDVQTPTAIPVELVDPVSPREWDDFMEELAEVKQLYVTAVDGYCLKVSRYQPLGTDYPMAHSFCRNVYCMGRCSVPREWRNPPQQEVQPNNVENDNFKQPVHGFGEDLAVGQVVSAC